MNQDFYVGYSPERIDPGDHTRRVADILKLTSGSTPEAASLIDAFYGSIITAGTYAAPSIRVAEAAKVIENTQRDLNIALVNELAIMFNRMEIDTLAVLEAAGTKWNFLPFRPGLVGGHCIGVDPYYLTHKAQSVGYYPQVILAGRRLNEGMGIYVANELVKAMIGRSIQVNGSRVLMMGVSFKENCPDLRNTRVVDIIEKLHEFNVKVDVYDPWVKQQDAYEELGLTLVEEPDRNSYDAIIIAVAHSQFREMKPSDFRDLCKSVHVLYDIKSIFPRESSDLRL
jgi:UDP-N-acetyl-D-galactosamine dehydrogenase